MKLIILFLLFINNVTFANCELYSTGYHTIATYEESPFSKLKILYNDPFLYSFKSIKGVANKIIFNGEECTLDSEEKSFPLEHNSYYRLKSCTNKLDGTNYFFIDKNKKQLITSDANISEETDLSEDIEKIIWDEINSYNFHLASDFSTNKEHKFEKVSMTHAKSNDLILTSTLVRVPVKNLAFKSDKYDLAHSRKEKQDEYKGKPLKAILFYITTLTKSKKTWVIADSGSDHCDFSIMFNLRNYNEEKQEATRGYSISKFSTYDINKNKSSDIVSFAGVKYFLDFGKSFVVIDEGGDYRSRRSELPEPTKK